jgi:hypothetical protein
MDHADSSAGDKTSDAEDNSLAVIGSASFRLSDLISLVAEANGPVAGYQSHTVGWGAGVKFITYRHTFAIHVSNTNATSADGLAAGTAFDGGDLLVGFSITRELSLAEQ